LAYHYKPVNLLEKEHQGDDFKKLNPLGLVPALEHDGHILTQSLAILEYLDDISPNQKLVWGDAAQKSKIRALSQIIACDIHPMNNLSVWKGYLGNVIGVSDQQSKGWYAHWIIQGLNAYEQMLQSSDQFSCGDQVSQADICLLPQLYNARRFAVQLDQFPNILKIETNMLALNWVKASLPENQPDAPKCLKAIYKL
jgi:maleylacetoacetate isomerase